MKTLNQTVTSLWAAPVATTVPMVGQLAIAPNASKQGSGLPFGGYTTYTKTPLTLGSADHVAVRQDDAAKVPPRERPV